MITSTIHDQVYEYYSWQDLGDHSFDLAKQILKKEGKFDRLIALAKSGLTCSRTLRDYLGIPHLSILDVEFYTGINETAKKPVINQSLPISIKNERILLYDDIVDTGETFSLAIQYLNFHGAASITTTSLFTKPWTSIKPNYSSRESKAWIICPHEIREMIGILTKLWLKKGDSPQKIQAQLLKIGLPESEVALFLSLQ